MRRQASKVINRLSRGRRQASSDIDVEVKSSHHMSQATLPGWPQHPWVTCWSRNNLRKMAAIAAQFTPATIVSQRLAIFLFVASVYITAFLGAFLLPNAVLRLLSTIICTILMGGLMVIGHDAAHQSLTPIRWLNHLIARLCFLPLYHPIPVGFIPITGCTMGIPI